MNSYNNLTYILWILLILFAPGCKRVKEDPGNIEDRLINYTIYYDPNLPPGTYWAYIDTTPEVFLRYLRDNNKIEIRDSIQLEKIKSIIPQDETVAARINVGFMVILEYQNYKDTLFLTGGLPPFQKNGLATTLEGISYTADSLYRYTYDIVVERDSVWQEILSWRLDLSRDYIDP